MRIGLMIPNLTSHDAIGNDVGMYRAIKGIAIDAYVFTRPTENQWPRYPLIIMQTWIGCARGPCQDNRIAGERGRE
jgi:hypothetical protein